MCAAAGHPVLRRDARRQSERSGVALPLGDVWTGGFPESAAKTSPGSGINGVALCWRFTLQAIEPPDPSELVNEESPLVQPQALLIKKDWESSHRRSIARARFTKRL